MSEWKKSIKVASEGKYPKNNFSAKLAAIYPTFNEKLKGMVLQLDFEDESVYNIPLILKSEKAKHVDGTFGIHEDATYDEFISIGQFLSSIERMDIKTGEPNMNNNDSTIVRLATAWAWDENHDPVGFKVYPDNQDPEKSENILIGCILHNVATKRQIGDDQQTSKYPDWTIGKIEGLLAAQAPKLTTAPTLKPAALKAKPAPKPAASAELHLPLNGTVDTDIYDVILGNPLPISGIYKQFGGKAKSPYQPGDLRVSLDRMKTQGKVIQTGDNFEGV